MDAAVDVVSADGDFVDEAAEGTIPGSLPLFLRRRRIKDDSTISSQMAQE